MNKLIIPVIIKEGIKSGKRITTIRHGIKHFHQANIKHNAHPTHIRKKLEGQKPVPGYCRQKKLCLA
jgi:hypothetical protein